MCTITTRNHEVSLAKKVGFTPIITSLYSEAISNCSLEIHPDKVIITMMPLEKSLHPKFGEDKEGYYLSVTIDIEDMSGTKLFSTSLNIVMQNDVFVVYNYDENKGRMFPIFERENPKAISVFIWHLFEQQVELETEFKV